MPNTLGPASGQSAVLGRMPWSSRATAFQARPTESGKTLLERQEAFRQRVSDWADVNRRARTAGETLTSGSGQRRRVQAWPRILPCQLRSERDRTVASPEMSRRAKSCREQVHQSAYSITSSASANNLSGISMFRDLAVLVFMARTYFVGKLTGIPAGFSPFRTRAT